MATIQELADEAFADLLQKHGIPVDLKDALRKSACALRRPGRSTKQHQTALEENKIMTNDPDPFEQGQRAARENIPAEGNPYRDGSEQHSLWAAGHERSPARPKPMNPRALESAAFSRSSSGLF